MTIPEMPLVTSVRAAPYRALGWLGAGLAADVAFDPAHNHVPLCPFHAVTGWWCPLCGGLRSANALARLRLADAWRDNLLFVSALPFIAWYFLDWTVRARSGGTRRPIPNRLLIALGVLALVFTVVRNLPPMVDIRPI